MKKQMIATAALFLLGLAAADSAFADRRGWNRGHGWHRGVGVGVVVGAPLWNPWWYYPPAPYYPPIVIERQAPPVYIEQPPPAPPPQVRYSGYWYYCQSPGGYYPEVRECPGGWVKVPPRP